MSVVTSEFHMPRTAAIFARVFALGGTAMGRQLVLDFHPVSDKGLFEPDALEARRGKEAQALQASVQPACHLPPGPCTYVALSCASTQRWRQDSLGLKDLAALHAWLHATHLCYAATRQVLPQCPACHACCCMRERRAGLPCTPVLICDRLPQAEFDTLRPGHTDAGLAAGTY